MGMAALQRGNPKTLGVLKPWTLISNTMNLQRLHLRPRLVHCLLPRVRHRCHHGRIDGLRFHKLQFSQSYGYFSYLITFINQTFIP